MFQRVLIYLLNLLSLKSALDSKSERMVQDTINNVIKGHTVSEDSELLSEDQLS